ncbi:MAG: hypothetical protein QOJ40_950, partial [Verrucomicrobiota bacterium]
RLDVPTGADSVPKMWMFAGYLVPAFILVAVTSRISALMLAKYDAPRYIHGGYRIVGGPLWWILCSGVTLGLQAANPHQDFSSNDRVKNFIIDFIASFLGVGTGFLWWGFLRRKEA